MTRRQSDDFRSDPIEDLMPLLLDVERNLDDGIDLARLAKKYGCSPFHFHRLFASSVGETPKQHIERLRLERAAYLLAITNESVLNIGLSVGFNSHETFSRAFKRRFARTPRQYRKAAKVAQKERVERNRLFRGDGCRFSEVKFVTLPRMSLLSIRHVGDYQRPFVGPFTATDRFWNELRAWAEDNGIAYTPLPIGIYYDDPTMTPKSLQRSDYCLPIDGSDVNVGAFRRIDFQGGMYGVIEHLGPYETIDQAYRGLADGIRRASSRYTFDEGPPIQIFRRVHIDGDPSLSQTEVYLPVKKAR